MCGIICFFGQGEGVVRVLEALHLLEYRAPDSAGLGVLAGPQGAFSVRRTVGATRQLVKTMVERPLYPFEAADSQAVAALLEQQGLEADKLRDCAGSTTRHFYQAPGLRVGVGDRGASGLADPAEVASTFSRQLGRTLEAAEALPAPDYDQDAVRHAFRLLAAHVASRADWDSDWRQGLDESLLERLPQAGYANWQEAWQAEKAANIPGQAFAVAVRQFQHSFPGLASRLAKEDWERVGGLTAQALAQVVVGHGRWAMVGAVTETNAHPMLDRSRQRVICENGSHNATLVLGLRTEQEAWWHNRGVPDQEPVHRAENTTEVIVYEWERAYHQLHEEEELPQDEQQFLANLAEWEVQDQEEQALRLALWRLRTGNTHACAFYSRRRPGLLYINSHRKPITIATRTIDGGEGLPPRRELMVASDVNAALMLWPGSEVDAASNRISALKEAIKQGQVDEEAAHKEIESLLDQFKVEVIYLDADVYQGEQLLVRLSNCLQDGQIVPEIKVSLYDGTPVAVSPQWVRLNPVMIGRRGYDTYTESHIAEIPDILDGLVSTYAGQGEIKLDSAWDNGRLLWPGLNVTRLYEQFGSRLQHLKRLLLIGEGSSWRDAQAAAPLLRELLPQVVVIVYRPVELLNIGPLLDPAGDLAVEISWSGTTDSVLKVDDLLDERGVMRLAITGRPQSDLGRRTAYSAGTLDVRSDVEVSVATVKGYEAILACLDLLALQLARIAGDLEIDESLTQLTDELTILIPQHVRTIINDQERRRRIRRVAERCRHFNKVAVIGGSPVDIEGELKIEELGQIVANTFEFHSASLRALIEHSAIVREDRHRTLFIINATTPERQWEARPIVSYLSAMGLFCIIHTTPHALRQQWETLPTVEVFVAPYVSPLLQPLVDAPFFFDLAVALAYARGLSPEEIDRPRNLAKSVTTTAAERREEIEARYEFRNVSLADFATARLARTAWDMDRAQPAPAALRATVAMRSALALIAEPLPELLTFNSNQHLIVVTDTEATENAAYMAGVAWHNLLNIDLTTYRRFISDLPDEIPDTALLRFIRAGGLLSVRDANTIALPTDFSPLQLEMLGAVYLMSLAVRLARHQGTDTTLWETGLAQLPLIIAGVLTDSGLAQQAEEALAPFVKAGYDKTQIIGGGQDHASAYSIARSFRAQGFMAEALYTDSAWHGPLATVGGPDADHDTLIFILATDPLFQAAALVDTQVYRTRNASVILIVPEGNEDSPAVRGVDPSVVLAVPALPRPFVPLVNIALGDVLAQAMSRLWSSQESTPQAETL